MALLFFVLFDCFMALTMTLYGVWFHTCGEQACRHLSGYAQMTEAQRARLDLRALGKSYAKSLWAMSFPFAAGALLDFVRLGLGCFLAWLTWALLFVVFIRKRIRTERGHAKASTQTGSHVSKQHDEPAHFV